MTPNESNSSSDGQQQRTCGYATQPSGLQETKQEKEGDETEEGEVNEVHNGTLRGNRHLRIECKGELVKKEKKCRAVKSTKFKLLLTEVE